MNGDKTYTIRRLGFGEGELYRSIRLEALRESPEAFSSSYEAALNRSKESWADQADAAAECDDGAIFTVDDGGHVALAALYRDQEKSGQVELVQMWIAPTHRRGGAGEALLNYLFDWAAKHSYEAVKAEVTNGNQRALRFYLKYGFVELQSEGGGTSLIKIIDASKI
jgi:GNAT superfamily N-acetyltransferase